MMISFEAPAVRPRRIFRSPFRQGTVVPGRSGAGCYLMALGLSLTACSSPLTPDKMAQIKPGMNAGQVETLLGRPERMEQSESIDQTLKGEVDYYPAPRGEGRVVYINRAVFKADFVAGAKS